MASAIKLDLEQKLLQSWSLIKYLFDLYKYLVVDISPYVLYPRNIYNATYYKVSRVEFRDLRPPLLCTFVATMSLHCVVRQPDCNL